MIHIFGRKQEFVVVAQIHAFCEYHDDREK